MLTSPTTDAEIAARTDAMKALMQDCPDLNHRVALLAFGLAAHLLRLPGDERRLVVQGFLSCVGAQLDGMDRMIGIVPTARLQ